MPKTANLRSARAIRRDNRLTSMQLLVIEAVVALGRDAYGLAIMDYVNERLGLERAIAPGQAYMTLKRLERDRGFLVVAETRTVRSSPPLKVYAVSPQGFRAQSIAKAEAETMHRAVMKGKGR